MFVDVIMNPLPQVQRTQTGTSRECDQDSDFIGLDALEVHGAEDGNGAVGVIGLSIGSDEGGPRNEIGVRHAVE